MVHSISPLNLSSFPSHLCPRGFDARTGTRDGELETRLDTEA